MDVDIGESRPAVFEDDPPARNDADESGCADPERCGINSLCDVCKAAARQRCDRGYRDGCPISADKPKCITCAARQRRDNVVCQLPDGNGNRHRRLVSPSFCGRLWTWRRKPGASIFAAKWGNQELANELFR
jgi:hypothetical protein